MGLGKFWQLRRIFQELWTLLSNYLPFNDEIYQAFQVNGCNKQKSKQDIYILFRQFLLKKFSSAYNLQNHDLLVNQIQKLCKISDENL